MIQISKRRWSCFSLRTLFAAVTIFAVWLGWQARIVHERNALRTAVELAASDSFEPYVVVATRDDGVTVRMWDFKWSKNPIPWYRRMLGDEPVGTLGVPNGWTASEVQRLKEAFPEARFSGHISVP